MVENCRQNELELVGCISHYDEFKNDWVKISADNILFNRLDLCFFIS